MAKNNRLGFTLLEVLLGLAIASFVLAAAYATLFSLSKAQQNAIQGMEQRRALRSIMDLLRRELSSTVYKNGDTRLHFVVEDRDFYGKPASTIQFASIGPPSDGMVADQQQVRYQVSEEHTNKLSIRRESRSVFAEGPRKNGYPILDGVEGFQVECYDGNKWVKTWDTTLTPTLPKMIRVTITVLEANEDVPYHLIATPRMVMP